MFKKIALIVLMACIVFSIILSSSCTCSTTPVTVNAAAEPPIAATGNPSSTPLETVEVDTEAISVSVFIENFLNNKYENGDEITISGTILEVWTMGESDGKLYAYATMSGGESLVVEFRSAGNTGLSSNNPGAESYLSVKKLKAGDLVTIRGMYEGSYPKQNSSIWAIQMLEAMVTAQ